jgi:hypothetical protein
VTDHPDAATGHRARGPATVARARPVVLLRYRPGIGGRTTRVVHLVPQPLAHQPDTAGIAFCGALLRPELVETVSPGQGARCILCTINHGAAAPAGRISRKTDAGTAASRYRAWGWGWPVTPRGHQVWLDLEPNTVALTIPAPLVPEATKLLHQWRCPPPRPPTERSPGPCHPRRARCSCAANSTSSQHCAPCSAAHSPELGRNGRRRIRGELDGIGLLGPDR